MMRAAPLEDPCPLWLSGCRPWQAERAILEQVNRRLADRFAAAQALTHIRPMAGTDRAALADRLAAAEQETAGCHSFRPPPTALFNRRLQP